MPLDNARAKRALEIIDSLKRLLDLVIAAQRHDISTAELIEAPRLPTDFTQPSATPRCISVRFSRPRT